MFFFVNFLATHDGRIQISVHPRPAPNLNSATRCAIDHGGPKNPSTMPRRSKAQGFFIAVKFVILKRGDQVLVAKFDAVA
jgi:hypothetical protein